MKVPLYDLQGNKTQDIELPKVFDVEVNHDLIKRAVLSIEAAGRQPYGANPRAGRENTANYSSERAKPQMHRIMNTGHARLPRLKNRRFLLQGQVADVPQAVHGPRAHPPKAWKSLREAINKKEKKKATQSAIAGTAIIELVKKRGHSFEAEMLPLIVVNEFEALKKTVEVKLTLQKLKIFSDVERAKDARSIRAGKGKRRGRKYKHKKSILIITSNEPTVVNKSARNLAGVEIVHVKDVNAKLLAPGTVPGRLTLWTENAVKQLTS